MEPSSTPAAAWRRMRILPALLLSLSLLAACGGNGDGGGPGTGSVEVSRDPVLLPADARNIVDEVNAGSDQANATLDESTQASVETSPALDVDDAVFKRARALGSSSIGSPGEIEEAVTFVPRQTDYPAQFVAFVKTDAPDNPSIPATNWLWTYEKAAADEPWKLAMYVVLPADFAAPEIEVDQDGFAQTVSEQEADDYKLAPHRVSEELAEYLSSYQTEVDSSIFVPGPYTSQLSQGLRAQAEREAAAEITATVKVEAGEFPLQAFKRTDGSALVVFSQNMAMNYAAAPGKSLKPLRGSEGLLEQGDYATIQRNVINMMAAEVPPATSEEMVRILGSTGGTVSFETT